MPRGTTAESPSDESDESKSVFDASDDDDASGFPWTVPASVDASGLSASAPHPVVERATATSHGAGRSRSTAER
jgi:hypothetical protein